jgi:hypothetical protein
MCIVTCTSEFADQQLTEKYARRNPPHPKPLGSSKKKKKKKPEKQKTDTWQICNLHKMMPMLSLQQDIMRWKH